jgi:glycosyltransferase involved in cell wall biosynthesis
MSRLSSGQNRVAVVHFCEALATGVLEVVRELANHTAAGGVPTVVVHGRRPETPSDLESKFDPRVRLVEVDGWGQRKPLPAAASMLRAAATLRDELRRYDGGVVHIHSTYAGLVGRLVPATSWKVFYSPHAYAFLNASLPAAVRAANRAWERLLGRRGRTIAVSRAEGAVASQLVGPERVLVVQNGIERKPVSPKQDQEPSFVVTSVGRASFQRQCEQFAEVAAQLGPELGAEFRWIGEGPGRETLERAGVEVTGWLPAPEVRAALENADVVLHLAAFEGLPFALLEAMAARRTIVASDLPPIREALGDAGLLVETSPEASQALRRLYDDPGLRRALADRARSRVERLFSRRAMIERTFSAYELERAS